MTDGNLISMDGAIDGIPESWTAVGVYERGAHDTQYDILEVEPELVVTDFAKDVDRTWNSDLSHTDAYANAALGIVGEAGEVSEHIKKFLYHGKQLDHTAVNIEIGDVLFYLQALLNTMGNGVTLEDCQKL